MDLVDRDSFWFNELKNFNTAIVANGEDADSSLSVQLLNSAERIICCDGALQKLLSINIIPSVVVGDGDSLDIQKLSSHNIFYHQDKSEEYNDLQKALKYCISNNYNNIILLGCAGLREDHFIANISIFNLYSHNLNLIMLTEHGVFNVMRKYHVFTAYPKMQVSIFVKDSNNKLSFRGLKYPVDNRNFNFFWEGSLNEAVDYEFSIEGSNDSPILVYRAK